MLPRVSRLVALLAAAAASAAAPAQHLGDVWVGASSQSQIAASPRGYVPEINYHTLEPVSGLLHGWTDADPGLDHITAADPANDIYPLQSGVQVWLQIVAIDPAFRLIDSAFNILDTVGQSTFLGGYNLHVHNTWHINSDDPAFDPQQCVWHVTVFLRDTSGGCTPSVPLTFSFTNVAVRPSTQPASGDFDQSGTVGAGDWPAMAECFNGPDYRPAPDDPAITTCEVTCLNAFDFASDQDVDLADFAEFQGYFNP